MTEQEILFEERQNTGTAWTRNKSFDKNGYLVIKDLWDPEELYYPLPEERGQIDYWGKKLDQFTHNPVEIQVVGSLARYWHPQYRQIHCGIRTKLEKIIGRKLYNTYYYDRYYFPGQKLEKHVDRGACEISVSVHIGTNLRGNKSNWPIWIKTPDTYSNEKKNDIMICGENRSIILNPGDGLIYKGCERPHWRDPMPDNEKKIFGNIFRKTKEIVYYHQIFFHYVIQDGERNFHAFDSCR